MERFFLNYVNETMYLFWNLPFCKEDLYWRRIPNGSQPQPCPTEGVEVVPAHILGKRTQAPRKVPVPGARSEKPLSRPTQKAFQVPKTT